MLILGIESSCDDAAAAVIETERAGFAIVRANTVANQDDIHRPYGGVVPELASRNHVLTTNRRWTYAWQKSLQKGDNS